MVSYNFIWVLSFFRFIPRYFIFFWRGFFFLTWLHKTLCFVSFYLGGGVCGKAVGFLYIYFMSANLLISLPLVAQTVKRLPAMQETWVLSLSQEDPLEKEMSTHSSILAWKIPWTEETVGCGPRGRRVGHDWATSLSFFLICCSLIDPNDLYIFKNFLTDYHVVCKSQQFTFLPV